MDLATVLPQLLPDAVAWVQATEAEALQSGRPLTPVETALALKVGVAHADLVRIKLVSQLPQPTEPPLLLAAANQTGLLGPQMAAVTFGHAIFVRHGLLDLRLTAHELRHVYQYEQAGSVGAFLAIYLQQIVTVGYDRSAYEIDARNHEHVRP